MSSNTNILNLAYFLRSSRSFPTDPQPLSVELSKSYIDIANNMNVRTIGIYPTAPSVTGDSWYISGDNSRKQTLRQVFTFTATGNVAHGINLAQTSGIVRAYGSFTDGTNWYGLIYGGSTVIAGQVSFYITPTNIVVQAGSSPPSITSGTIVLEWLSNV